MKPIIPRPPDWKKEVPHPLISEFRDKFRLPYINCELMVDTSRYGSNAHRDYPPKGITPNVTYAHVKNQEKRKKMTTYQTDYSNVYDGLASILKNMEPARINAHLCTVSKRDKLFGTSWHESARPNVRIIVILKEEGELLGLPG
uniref:Uncharacterized protein n=1 Tax=Callorhinchus milii TaxID=7868 RepID=A0A4W3ILM9_CALMI